jgi:Rod binding domain-containing protein
VDISAVASTLAAPSSKPLPKDLEGACRAFEGEFSAMVFRKMREAMVPKSSKGSSGFAQDTTQELLDSQWAQLSSQGEGLGLWRSLCRQLDPAPVKSPAGKADEKSMMVLRPQDLLAPGAAKHVAPAAGQHGPMPGPADGGHADAKDSDTP